VLAEATYLLRRVPGAALGVLELVSRGILQVKFRLDTEVLALRTLMTRYRSVPMSLADACLVRMSELDPKAVVVTLDQDFRIYRRSGRLAIPVIMPG
jgi:predicted nucleic acid-binding protein